jgi:orotidine-5'-phosphate decarboxylase
MTQVIVALDVDTLAKQESLLKALKGTIVWYKVGLQLFTSQGKRAVDLVRKYGGKVFLDL